MSQNSNGDLSNQVLDSRLRGNDGDKVNYEVINTFKDFLKTEAVRQHIINRRISIFVIQNDNLYPSV